MITGETGAGKSILLGGLSLVLGKRADRTSLRNPEAKCVIEAEFSIEKYGLASFFEAHDLDYDSQTLLRREILPSGKSRAFINDSPVTLDIVSALGNLLIDVHSQHETLQLTQNEFQLRVIDALAGNQQLLGQYQTGLKQYKETLSELQELVAFQKAAAKELDYNTFLLEELNKAPLVPGALEELETLYEELNNVETILENLGKGHQLLNNEPMGIVPMLSEVRQAMARIADFGPQYGELRDRMQSALIEMDDISAQIQTIQEKVEANPSLLEETNAKLQLLHSLQKKHGVESIEALLEVRSALGQKVEAATNVDAQVLEKEKEVGERKASLVKLAQSLRAQREKAIPKLKAQLGDHLVHLGMPHARFSIELSPSDALSSTGMDVLRFQFSANKGGDFGALKKVASGGELSRIMLAIKSILAQYENLPTIMFDEIDTGVSGEISDRMGDIMGQMGQTMQVFCITHLPQVASKGHHHFKVFKEDGGQTTTTQIKVLSTDERVVELAGMLGGRELTDSALAHARQLLN